MNDADASAPSNSARLCELLQPYAGRRRGDPDGPALESLRAAAPFAPSVLRDAIESVLQFHTWAEAHPMDESQSEDSEALQEVAAQWFGLPEVVEWMKHRQTILQWAKRNCEYRVPALPVTRPGRGDSGLAGAREPRRPPPEPGEIAGTLIP